jgi:hypothetical protein
MAKYDDVLIDITIDEPSRSSPALGHIDKLLKQSALETQSLQVVRRMMMRDMIDRAQVTGVSKLTAAAGIREKHRQALLPAGVEQTNGFHAESPKKRKKKKAKDGRKPKHERVATLRHYLEQHPGQDTYTIATALNWQPNQVTKFARGIAKSKKQGHKQPLLWTLRNGASASSAPKRSTRNITPYADRKSLQQRQEEIRAFLSQHPESFTKQIAQAMQIKQNSHLVRVLRSIARPAHPTTATQPIQWVLQQQAS